MTTIGVVPVRYPTILFLSFFLTLACCSSLGTAESPQSTKRYGEEARLGHLASFFWCVGSDEHSRIALDLFLGGEKGHYKTLYYWSRGHLKEVIRRGYIKGLFEKTIPFSIQLRLSENGETLYQHYVIDKNLFPLQESRIQSLKDQANSAMAAIATKGKGMKGQQGAQPRVRIVGNRTYLI